MNLGGMGAAGMDQMAQQIAASGNREGEGEYHGTGTGANAQAGPGPNTSLASNAGLITSMANV